MEEVTTEELISVRDKIELMPKFNHVEILKILKKYDSIILNENKNGTLINLAGIDRVILNELNTYISYVNTQESHLSHLEKQKEDFKNIYFAKDNKDI
jgi:F420-0:gamma-glutamyl ligase